VLAGAAGRTERPPLDIGSFALMLLFEVALAFGRRMFPGATWIRRRWGGPRCMPRG